MQNGVSNIIPLFKKSEIYIWTCTQKGLKEYVELLTVIV